MRARVRGVGNVTGSNNGVKAPGIGSQIIEGEGHPPLVKIVSRAETSEVESSPVQIRGARSTQSCELIA